MDKPIPPNPFPSRRTNDTANANDDGGPDSSLFCTLAHECLEPVPIILTHAVEGLAAQSPIRACNPAPSPVKPMDIALYQPDIPQNTGAILRLAACMNIGVHIVAPCGFDMSERALRRAGLDYIEHARIHRHGSFEAFGRWRIEQKCRLVLLTTQAEMPYTALTYQRSDILLLGRESAGVGEEVHEAADERVLIPMAPGRRSLNIVTAAAMVLGEGLRQTDGFPG